MFNTVEPRYKEVPLFYHLWNTSEDGVTCTDRLTSSLAQMQSKMNYLHCSTFPSVSHFKRYMSCKYGVTQVLAQQFEFKSEPRYLSFFLAFGEVLMKCIITVNCNLIDSLHISYSKQMENETLVILVTDRYSWQVIIWHKLKYLQNTS